MKTITFKGLAYVNWPLSQKVCGWASKIKPRVNHLIKFHVWTDEENTPPNSGNKRFLYSFLLVRKLFGYSSLKIWKDDLLRDCDKYLFQSSNILDSNEVWLIPVSAFNCLRKYLCAEAIQRVPHLFMVRVHDGRLYHSRSLFWINSKRFIFICKHQFIHHHVGFCCFHSPQKSNITSPSIVYKYDDDTL